MCTFAGVWRRVVGSCRAKLGGSPGSPRDRDAKHMARDVHVALSKVIEEVRNIWGHALRYSTGADNLPSASLLQVGGKTHQGAEDYLKALAMKRRFQQDVWS